MDTPWSVNSKYSRRCVYEYKWKEKKYKYILWCNEPPSTLTLYFLKNPRKATVKDALINWQINWFVVYMFMVASLHFASIFGPIIVIIFTIKRIKKNAIK